jgi:hypothetical protein
MMKAIALFTCLLAFPTQVALAQAHQGTSAPVASDGKLTFLQDTFAPFMFTGGMAPLSILENAVVS